jgi:hypothetical protein
LPSNHSSSNLIKRNARGILEDCAITKATEEARQSHVWKLKLRRA